MFDSTKDILYLVIAFCILWVTVFLCWMFYYIAKILRNTSHMVEEFRMKLQALSETVNHVRNKVESLSSLFTLGTQGVGGFVRKTVSKKAKKMVDEGTQTLNKAAKEAVDEALKKAADGMSRTAKKIKP